MSCIYTSVGLRQHMAFLSNLMLQVYLILVWECLDYATLCFVESSCGKRGKIGPSSIFHFVRLDHLIIYLYLILSYRLDNTFVKYDLKFFIFLIYVKTRSRNESKIIQLKVYPKWALILLYDGIFHFLIYFLTYGIPFFIAMNTCTSFG